LAAETELAGDVFEGIEQRLEVFLKPLLRLLPRREQQEHAVIYNGRQRPEVLVVVRNDRDSKTWTYLASDTRSNLKELVRVGACRHGIEQALNMGKGDVGLDEYELRSWVGWHHHMTLSMMSLWFIVCEHRRIKKILLQSPLLRSVVRSLSQPSSSAARHKSPPSSTRSSAVTTRPVAATGNVAVVAHHRG
jgi:hypothetical protein